MEVRSFTLRKAVFLDRDGVINRKAVEHDYIKSCAEFHLLPGAGEAIGRLNKAGFLVIVVTNQQGVAKGMMSLAEVDSIHSHMRGELSKRGAHIDGIYVCPHRNGTCTCRKPDIGLFLQAERDFKIDRGRSWMIGDSDSDVEAGRRFGVRTIRTEDLAQAVVRILGGIA